jgi:diguanylate cyclase (GGDEF)-like protein/PAS domain S-box-containing protein
LRDANRTLDAEKNMNQTIIQSSPLAIYTRDMNGIVTAWNSGAEQMFGWREEEILGQPMLTVPTQKLDETESLRQRVLNGERVVQAEVKRQRRDGSLIYINTTLAPLRDSTGQMYGYLAIAADITERKAAEQRIEFLAYHDTLTGLPNRLLVQDRFEQAIAYADRARSKVALIFLDLDNFKTINDSLGHNIGDALLKEIAVRLGECVRDTDTISRQGGDEFLIVLPALHDADAIAPVLVKILARLQDPFLIEGNELSTSVSIGIALYPDDGGDFDTLLKKADMAMYRAKDAGRNAYHFFDEQMNVEAVEHLSMRNGLRKAVERGEFVLHYQPQIDLKSGAVVGAEALIRWHHPELGMIPPARFIPVAEESGLIVPIGEWVMQEACRQAMAWQRAGLPEILVAVNLSAVQFKRGDVEQTVIGALEESGFDPALLELEITESILIQNVESVLDTVKRLKLLGVKLSIDDFGTGYSSLSYLKRFDVDKLKIDQSFVRDLAVDPDDAAIIRAIIQMAHSLNLRTIAEGVENEAMLEQLRIFSCDEVQGFHFARPMPAEEFSRYLLGERNSPTGASVTPSAVLER